MGATHSRARPIPGSGKTKKLAISGAVRRNDSSSNGYFILSLKGDKIKVVNASSAELKILTVIISRHCEILKSGWDRHLTFSFRLKKSARHCVIQLVADALLELYTMGWEPMTPIDMGVKGQDFTQTAICFKRNREKDVNCSKETLGSNFSLSGLPTENERDSCLCLETYQSNYMGFLNVPNTVLHDVVTTVQQEWEPGIAGISMAVSSVISDYTSDTLKVLPSSSSPELQEARYMKLNGLPWTADSSDDYEDSICAENLQLSIIACLSRQQYQLSMSINMDKNSRVFFFIRDNSDPSHGEVRVPTFAGFGLGEKDGMSVHRPIVVRSKSSFFRSYRSTTVKNRIKKSFRRKAINNESNVMSYKPQNAGTAWWQQSSTDVSSDYEFYEGPSEMGNQNLHHL